MRTTLFLQCQAVAKITLANAEDFATYIHRHLGTFDSKVLEQREPYIANETDMAAKALAQEIRNSQALKEMQPEWELFRLENA